MQSISDFPAKKTKPRREPFHAACVHGLWLRTYVIHYTKPSPLFSHQIKWGKPFSKSLNCNNIMSYHL